MVVTAQLDLTETVIINVKVIFFSATTLTLVSSLYDQFL